MEELKKYGETSKVHFVQCDLKDLKKTQEVAEQLKGEKQIDAVSGFQSNLGGSYTDTWT